MKTGKPLNTVLDRLTRVFWLLVCLCIAAPAWLPAQGQASVGIQKFGAYGDGPDTVDIGTLQIHLQIPLYHKAGRGQQTEIAFMLNDAAAWPTPWIVGADGKQHKFETGLGLSIGNVSGSLTSVSVTHQCRAMTGSGTYTDYAWTYVDALGNSHLFQGTSRSVTDSNNTCASQNITSLGLTSQASDGSGYLIQVGSSGFFPTSITGPSGTVYSPSLHPLVAGLQDTNGNAVGFGSAASGSVCAITSPCMDDHGNIVSYLVQDTVGTSIQLSGGGYSADFSTRNPLVLTYLDDNGNPQHITLNYKMYQFNVAGSLPEGFLDNITFPDGSAYHFSYVTDSTGALIYVSPPSQVPTALASITLPSGGNISYGYPGGVQASYNPTGIDVGTCTVTAGCILYTPSLNRTTSDGTTTYTRTITSLTSTPACCAIASSFTQVAKANSDETTVYFVVPNHQAVGTGANGGNFVLAWGPDLKVFETKRLEYSHTNLSTPVRTTMRCYNGATGDCTATQVNEPVTQLAVTTTLDNGLSSQTVTQYTGNGLPTEVDEYDFGATTPTRKTITSYESLSNNISDRPATVIVEDVAGNIAKKTLYTYDEATPPPMTLPGHTTVSGSRGNATTVVEWVNNSGTQTRSTRYAFDDAGQVTSVTDPNANPPTTYSYDPTTDAYRTKITRPTTNGTAHVSTFGYGPNSGLVTTAYDENSLKTTNVYDSMFRLSSVTRPDGGQITYAYTPTSTTTNVLQQTGVWMSSQDQYDGYGRKAHHVEPDGSTTDYGYDSLGRLSTESNPHFTTASMTDGITSYQYDALSRVIQVAPPDGTTFQPDSPCLANNVCTQYSGNTTTVTDQAGKQRRSVRDALGQLIEVDEPGDASAGTVASGTLTIGGNLLGENPATTSTGSVTISSNTGERCDTSDTGTICQNGTVSISFNNGAETDTVSYGSGDSTSTVAANLASAINNCGLSTCYATAAPPTGATVNFTSTATGTGANWPVSTSYNAPAPSAFWWTGTVQTPNSKTGAPGCLGSVLFSGQNLFPGQCLNSPNGRFVLSLQTDGNLVLYDDTPDPNPWIPLWSTGTSGRGVDHGYMQSQGNFVLYAGTTAVWSSPYSSVNAYYLVVQDDGNLVIYTNFPGFSFTIGPSQQTMTGGQNAGPGNDIYDSGTVTVSVGSSFTATACYGPSGSCTILTGCPTGNSTASQVACFLTSSANPNGLNRSGSPVSATSNGASITFTYSTVGYAGNVNVTATSSPNNPSMFPGGSFSGSTALSNGQDAYPSGLAHPFTTLYTYDLLGNLTCAEQHGDASTGTGCSASPSSDATSPWRVRRFTYDLLSRLIAATNPESGTISHQYDNNGNMVSKTDARQITTNYSVDALNRVVMKTYSDGTPTVKLGYDGVAPTGCTPPKLNVTNGIGNRTSMCDGAGTEAWSFAITKGTGWKTTQVRTTNGVTKTSSYQNNFANFVTSLTYPSGSILTYTPDVANRETSVADTGHKINYVTAAAYGAGGQVTGFVNGGTITNTFLYNNRLQVCRMTASSTGAVPTSCTNSSGNVLDLGYDFHLGNSDNGDVYGITNYRDQSRNQAFTYDALNRLASAQNAGTDCSQKPLNPNQTKFWGDSYTYDAWGNLYAKTVTKCKAENLNVTVLTNNRFSGYGYDISGNMTSDPTDGVTSTFDAENRIATTTANSLTTTYAYDGDGNRVKKSAGSTGTLYWYASDGVVAESDLSGSIQSEYIFFTGDRVARRDEATGAGGVFYYFSDHLGSTSVITDSAGNIKAESDYFPWGEEVQFVNNDSNHYKFTGKERDSESGLDDFGFRYNSSLLGRFLSPDAPFADQEPGDPQSLNLYTIVRNNPETLVDADGRTVWLCVKTQGGQMQCTRVSDDDYAHARETDAKNGVIAPPLFSSGVIMCRGGVVCGYAVYDPRSQGIKDEGLGIFDIFLMPGGFRIFGGGARAGGEVLTETAAKELEGKIAAELAEEAIAESVRAAQQAMEAETKRLVDQATKAVGDEFVQATSKEAAEQAAKEWAGEGARVIVNRKTKVPVGFESADKTRVVRFTSVNKAQPYINLENKVTGGNVHVKY